MTSHGAAIRAHYQGLLREHGPDHRAVQYSSAASQDRRFAILADAIGPRDSVLDVGAGLGDCLRYLREKRGFRGRYSGIDLVPEFVEHARDAWRGDDCAEFHVVDVIDEQLPQGFDVAILSGVFNNLMEDNWAFITQVLSKMYHATTKAVAVNALSTYVDYRDSGLYYCDPLRLFDYVKRELTRKVTLRHDYVVKDDSIPFEFALFLYH